MPAAGPGGEAGHAGCGAGRRGGHAAANATALLAARYRRSSEHDIGGATRRTLVTSPAAWLPDPTGKHDHRWWDGERWTEHVADAGTAATDPLGPHENPAAPGEVPSTGDGPGAGDAATEEVWGAGAGGAGSQRDAGQRQGGQRPASEPQATAEQSGSWDEQPTAEQPVWGQQPGGPGGWEQQPGQSGWDRPAGAPAWEQGSSAWGQPASRGSDGVALAALIVGILSLLIAFVPIVGLIGVIGGVIALVLGFVGRGRIKRTQAGGNGMAVTGIVTGILAILLGLLITGGLFALGGTLFGDSWRDYQQCIEETGDTDLCTREFQRDIMDVLEE
jgi:hypothetical protein